MMEVGRGQVVHVEAPKAHIIARCLNENTDFSATEAGKAHLHMILILAKDGNLVMAKMKLGSIIARRLFQPEHHLYQNSSQDFFLPNTNRSTTPVTLLLQHTPPTTNRYYYKAKLIYHFTISLLIVTNLQHYVFPRTPLNL